MKGMTGAVYIKGVAVTKYKRSAVKDTDEWPSKYSKFFVENFRVWVFLLAGFMCIYMCTKAFEVKPGFDAYVRDFQISDNLKTAPGEKIIKPKVGTVCFGVAASTSALLLAGGEKGMRYWFASHVNLNTANDHPLTIS